MAKNLTTILPSVIASRGSIDNLPDRKFWTYTPYGHAGVMGGNMPSYDRCEEAYGHEKWVVPTGVTKAKFEIWGGGGNGSPANCCMYGPNGGSGAYAYKEINVTAGDVYTMCACNLCQQFCCMNGGSCDPGTIGTFMFGCRGSNAGITGNGLTNFCAEGGNGGVALARWVANETAYRCMIEHSCQPGENRVGAGGTLHCANDAITRNMCLTMRDFLYCRTCTLASDLEDSTGDPHRRACYYGADGGYRGLWSYIRLSCCGHMCTGNDAHACGHKNTMVIPGGQDRPNRAACGTYIEYVYSGSCSCSMDVHSGGNTCHPTSLLGIRNRSSSIEGIGVGGRTAFSWGGTCCCGAVGGAPMFRVSYC
jgi:hypothetical protein